LWNTFADWHTEDMIYTDIYETVSGDHPSLPGILLLISKQTTLHPEIKIFILALNNMIDAHMIVLVLFRVWLL